MSADGDYNENYRKHRPYSDKNYSYTATELDEMAEVLLEAERIKADTKVFRMVQQHMSERGDEIRSIQDLRDKMAGGYGE